MAQNKTLSFNMFNALAVDDAASSSEDEAPVQQRTSTTRTRVQPRPSTPKTETSVVEAPPAPRKRRKGKGVPLDLSKIPDRKRPPAAMASRVVGGKGGKGSKPKTTYRRLKDGTVVKVSADGTVVPISSRGTTGTKSRKAAPQQAPQPQDFPSLGGASAALSPASIGSWAQGIQTVLEARDLEDPAVTKARKAEKRAAWLLQRRREQRNQLVLDDDGEEEDSEYAVLDAVLLDDDQGYEQDYGVPVELEELEPTELASVMAFEELEAVADAGTTGLTNWWED